MNMPVIEVPKWALTAMNNLAEMERKLAINGHVVNLRHDQALALYVTGGSLSDFAFDVSVHLWQRRADCTDEPSDLMDDCPPMNEAEWFDTYIPCAVLHVPRGS